MTWQTEINPTDDLLLNWIRKDFKLADGFELTHDEMVLPLTVTELWDNFFADYAPYSFDDVAGSLGFLLNSKTEWLPPKPEEAMFKGQPVIKRQVVEMKTMLPPNPFSRYID